MKFSELLTLILAGYGALLATIMAIVSILQQREKRAQIQVLAYVASVFASGGKRPADEDVICIKVINQGHMPVCVSSVGYAVPKKKSLYAMLIGLDGDTLPHDLLPGKSIICTMPARVFARDMDIEKVKIRFHAYDATGRIWHSKRMVFNVADYKRQPGLEAGRIGA